MATNEISSTNDIISCYSGVIKAAFSVSECMLVSQNLDFCEPFRYFLFLSSFSLCFSFNIHFYYPLYRLSLAWNFDRFPFQERDKFNQFNVRSMFLVFLSVTLSGLVKILMANAKLNGSRKDNTHGSICTQNCTTKADDLES